MPQTTYRDIPDKIRRREPFAGNSLSAGNRPTFLDRGRGDMTVPREADYVIWSYGTPIGYAIGEELYVTSERFSVTTSRGQNILRELGAREVTP